MVFLSILEFFGKRMLALPIHDINVLLAPIDGVAGIIYIFEFANEGILAPVIC